MDRQNKGSYWKELAPEVQAEYTVKSDWVEHYPNGARRLVSRDVPLDKIVFDRPMVIDPSDARYEIRFTDCIFLYDCKLAGESISHPIVFDRCMFDESLTISGLKTESALDLINIKAKGQVLVTSGTFDECRWSLKDKTRLVISSGTFKKLQIGYWGESKIGEVSLSLEKITGVLELSREIDIISIRGTASEVSLSVNDATVRIFSIYRFRNEKGFRVLNLRPAQSGKDEISISESYLGKSEFYNIDFSRFDDVYIRDSHIVESSFVNIKWSDDIKPLFGSKAGHPELTKTLLPQLEILGSLGKWKKKAEIRKTVEVTEYFTKQRELYRQIKYALSKQGDSIGEQWFHTKELLAHRQALKGTNKSIGTKLILTLSSWTSDFGQSIKRPLVSLLAVHWLLLMLLIATGFYRPQLMLSLKPNREGFELAFQEFFRLINPLRRGEGDFRGYYIIIDAAMRVWSSYMIYNFVRASRRFIK